MSSEWKPDDSFLEKKGQVGVDLINDVLKKHNISLDRIVTSRDAGMDQVRHELERTHMPRGWQNWQLPIYMAGAPAFTFLSVGSPGAVLPEHSHETNQFRLVLAGSMIYNGVELKTGDWMFIPKNHPYGVTAGFNPGVIIFYSYW